MHVEVMLSSRIIPTILSYQLSTWKIQLIILGKFAWYSAQLNVKRKIEVFSLYRYWLKTFADQIASEVTQKALKSVISSSITYFLFGFLLIEQIILQVIAIPRYTYQDEKMS